MAQDRRIELATDPDTAFVKVRDAVIEVGKLRSDSETTRTLEGKVKYGLQSIVLRISVLSGGQPGTSIVEFTGKGKDVWGAGPRKAMDKVVSAIR